MITNTFKTIALLPFLLSTYFLKLHWQADKKEALHQHSSNILHATRLPVRFNSFNLVKDQGSVLLHWQTVEEQSSVHYVVERGDDGRTYNAVATVPSKVGNDTSNYTFKDKAPLNGKSFYRIRQLDRNGAYAFSPVRAILYMPNKQLHFAQRRQELTIVYHSDGKKEYTLFDMQGTLIQQGTMRGNKCVISGLLPGSYILSLKTVATTVNTTVMITR
jgi:hypothetical protein